MLLKPLGFGCPLVLNIAVFASVLLRKLLRGQVHAYVSACFEGLARFLLHHPHPQGQFPELDQFDNTCCRFLLRTIAIALCEALRDICVWYAMRCL